MRYRKLTPDGDYSFGHGQGDLLINNREAVAQAVLTRLRLLTGEWFLDTEEGTPYSTQILGMHTMATYDTAIRERILGTEGVLGIIQYSSNIGGSRNLTVNCAIQTIFAAEPVEIAHVAVVPTILETEGGSYLTTESGALLIGET